MSSFQLMLLLAVSLLLVQVSESRLLHLGYRSCSPVKCAWDNWSEWGDCNHPCGNAGTQSRSRSLRRGQFCGGAACSDYTTNSQACNRFCHNGGSPMEGYCTCPKDFSGTCCGKRKSHMLGSCKQQLNRRVTLSMSSYSSVDVTTVHVIYRYIYRYVYG